MPLSMARITEFGHYSAGQSVGELNPLEPVRTCGAPRLADGSRWDPRWYRRSQGGCGTGRVAGPVASGRRRLRAPRGPKRRMRIGFYVNAVREVDWTAENFLVDFYWWIRYPKPASEGDRKLAESLEFVNGDLGVAAEVLEQEVQERKTVPGPAGDEEYIAFRSVGRFYFDADFRSYPLDRQKLPIVIEHEVLTTEELELVDDEDSYRHASGPEERWGLAPSLRIPGLEIERATRAFTTQEYHTNFGDPTNRDGATSFARVTFTIEAARNYGAYEQDSDSAADHPGARLPCLLRASARPGRSGGAHRHLDPRVHRLPTHPRRRPPQHRIHRHVGPDLPPVLLPDHDRDGRDRVHPPPREAWSRTSRGNDRALGAIPLPSVVDRRFRRHHGARPGGTLTHDGIARDERFYPVGWTTPGSFVMKGDPAAQLMASTLLLVISSLKNALRSEPSRAVIVTR